MPIQHAVLALLESGPSHGYELKSAFDTSVGPQWGALNIGHLYQVLERLSRDGLVVSERQPQQIKPDRVVYEITAAGRAELNEWLAEPSPRTGGYRDDFFLKLVAAAQRGDPATTRSVISAQRAHLLRELHNLEGLRAAHDSEIVVTLLLSAAIRHVAADLEFLDDAEHVLSGAAATALIAPARTSSHRSGVDRAS
jgi:DNA-binding PadR family transcriptional regulator